MLDKIKAVDISGVEKDYQVLFHFRMNEKQVVIYKNDEIFSIGYMENNYIKPIIVDAEKEMLKQVVTSIDSSLKEPIVIDYGYTYYNNQTIKVTFDTKKWKRIFQSVDGEPLKEEDAKILDQMWNEESDILYLSSDSGKEMKCSNPLFKKLLIKVGTYSMIVFMSVSVLTSSIDVSALDWNNENYLEIVKKEEKQYIEKPNTVIDHQGNTRATIDMVVAIATHDNITDEDKGTLISFYPLFNNNSDYFDLNFIIPRIEKLKIEYKEKKDIFRAGSYTKSSNLITIYNNEQFIYDKEFKKGVLGHEFLHAITSLGGESTAFHEGCTEMLVKEYMNEFSTNIYQNQQACVRMLCEIVGEQKVREAYFKGDDTILLDALSNNHYELYKDAIKLLVAMDDELMSERSITRYNAAGEQYFSEKLEEVGKINAQAKKEIIQLMSKFYYVQKGTYATNNKLMLAYFDDLNENTNYANSNRYIDGDTNRICVNKSYFNPELRALNKNARVIYYYNETMVPTKDGDIRYYDEDIIVEQNNMKNIGTR